MLGLQNDPWDWFCNVPSVLPAIHRFLLQRALINFYLITDVHARTCDYCFHMKWEAGWISSLLNYRPKSVKMEGKGQLNWQLAKLDMFGKNENERLWTLCYKLGRNSTFCWYFFFVSRHYIRWQSRWSRLSRKRQTAETLTYTCPLHSHI